MALVSRVNIVDAALYRGCSLKTRYMNKSHAVYLKLLCGDNELEECLEFARVTPSVLMLEYQGTGSNLGYLTKENTGGLYVGVVVEYGNDIVESDVERLISNYPDGVTIVIKVPDDFSDMRTVITLCNKYDNIRFCGGKLFALEGARVGMIGVDTLESVGIKIDDSYYYAAGDDVMQTVDIECLELTRTVGKVKKPKTAKTSKAPKSKSTESTGSVKKSTKKPTKKSMHFGTMLQNLSKVRQQG